MWDLPGLGIEPVSPALEGDSLPLSHQGSPVLNLNWSKILTQGFKLHMESFTGNAKTVSCLIICPGEFGGTLVPGCPCIGTGKFLSSCYVPGEETGFTFSVS